MSSTGEGAPLPPPSGSPAAAIAADDDLTAAVDAINLDAPHVGGSATPTTGSDVDDSDDEGLAAASAGGPPVEPIDPTVTAADARAAKAAGNTAYAAGDHTAAVAAYTTALSAAPGVVPPAERAVFWADAERQQGEAMAALKDMGNAFLKPFGIDLNAFKAEKDPSTGSYNIKFGG